MAQDFVYEQAFGRNVGWVTHAQQEILRARRIAIAGLGGVGGSHLLTLARVGVGRFHLAELDRFELVNFNRQVGADMTSLGRPKLEVMVERAAAINPQLELRTFPQGLTRDNLPAFFEGVDLFIDGLDFFQLDIRRAAFHACYQRDIPALTVAPLGMGAALLVFMPGKMRFDDYFGFQGRPHDEQLLRFLLGLAPRALQSTYLVDPSTINLAEHRGPSSTIGCELCAAIAASTAIKILLGRGDYPVAPRGLHFDAYRNKLVHTWRSGGHRHPLSRLALRIARRRMLAGSPAPNPAAPPPPRADAPLVERLLELARWSPSGDNSQPWRFEILDPQRRFLVHGHDTRDHCLYDLQGRASQLAHGALLETIAIAATSQGCRAVIQRQPDAPDTHPRYAVELVEDAGVSLDPLAPYVTVRSTHRRRYRRDPLLAAQRAALEASLPAGFGVMWFERPREKRRLARLLFSSAWIRLSIPEAYQVHAQAIQWHARYSEDRLPDQAVGLDGPALALMRWAMKSWGRVCFLNRFLAGTLLPRWQLDYQPAVRCAAHFVILSPQTPTQVDDFVAAGRAVQRFWLTAAAQRLQLQPQQTPLIFADYANQGLAFCGDQRALDHAAVIRARLAQLLGGEEVLARAMFLGRVGTAQPPASRSVRLPLAQLLRQSI